MDDVTLANGMYDKAAIREKRQQAEKRLAMQRRCLAALDKIAQGHEELEQANRELEALDRGEALPEQPPAATKPPWATGERARHILMERPGVRHSPRDVAARVTEKGWAADVDDALMQRLRHSLRRLATRDPEVECDESGMTKYYWYAPKA